MSWNGGGQISGNFQGFCVVPIFIRNFDHFQRNQGRGKGMTLDGCLWGRGSGYPPPFILLKPWLGPIPQSIGPSGLDVSNGNENKHDISHCKPKWKENHFMKRVLQEMIHGASDKKKRISKNRQKPRGWPLNSLGVISYYKKIKIQSSTLCEKRVGRHRYPVAQKNL